MIKSVVKLLFTAIIVSGIHPSIHAQITFPLDTVEVTASRISVPVKESGKSVSILSREDIEAMPVTSVDELLQSLPGVNLNSRNAFGVQADIGMRGSTFSQVLVLVDNIRINDPLTAHFNNNIPVSLAEIERIEIVRGPAATSYGADAVGGIIHIKTKTFVRNSSTQRDVSGTIDAGVGEHGLLLTDGGFYAQIDKLQLSGGFKTSLTDGPQLQNPNFGQVSSADSLFNNDFDLQTYTLSAAYQFNEDWRAYSRIGYDTRDFAAKFFYTQSTFDESREEVSSWWSQFALERTAGNHSTELNAGYKKTDDLFVFNPAFTPNQHTMEQLVVSLDHEVRLTPQTKVTFGTQAINKAIESTDRGDHNTSSIGFYGIVSTQLAEHLITNASARVEYDDNFGTEFLPQLSIAAPFENITFRSSFGKAIRAGDYTERFVSSLIPDLAPGRNIGNPDLEAETSYTFDIGFDVYPSAGFTISNTAFYRTSDNLIDYTLTNSNDINNADNLMPGEDYFYATNVSNSETFGIESLIGKYFALPQSNLLHTELNFTYLYTTNDEGDVSKYIANHPIHDLSLILSFQSTYFDVTTTSHFISRNNETVANINGDIKSSYSVHHLKVQASPFSSQPVSVYMKVHNLLDEQYQEILGAQMPGRWIMGGVKWDFKTSL